MIKMDDRNESRKKVKNNIKTTRLQEWINA